MAHGVTVPTALQRRQLSSSLKRAAELTGAPQDIGKLDLALGRFFQTIGAGSFLVQRGGAFGKLTSGAALSAGLITSRVYDGRRATAPPPFFPVVTNQYEILSWQTASQML